MRKIKICGIVIIGGLLSLTYSCLGGGTETNDWELGNAQIGSFSLASDSITGLSDVLFTIDQVNGLIYNRDSMRFGTPNGHKAIATVGFDSPYGVRGIYFIEQSTGDTVQSVSDSIDFSEPVTINVIAYDGVMTKTYEAKLNIHQVNPDTMVWAKYADILPGRTFSEMKVIMFNDSCYMYTVENSVYQLYKSDMEDLVNWERCPVSGLPGGVLWMQLTLFQDALYVITDEGHLFYSSNGQEWTQAAVDLSLKALLGYLPASEITGREDVLCCIAGTDDGLQFVSIDKQMSCTLGQYIPEAFPLSGFGQLNYETMYYPRLVIASGRDAQNRLSDKAWATMDGLGWASLSNLEKTFSNREGATVFFYDYCFFVMGGVDEYASASKDIHFSIDQGVTWFEKFYVYNSESEEYELESFYVMPDEFMARGYASIIIDKDNYMLLFGGKARNDTNVINEIWRGRINRLGFGKSR